MQVNTSRAWTPMENDRPDFRAACETRSAGRSANSACRWVAPDRAMRSARALRSTRCAASESLPRRPGGHRRVRAQRPADTVPVAVPSGLSGPR